MARLAAALIAILLVAGLVVADSADVKLPAPVVDNMLRDGMRRYQAPGLAAVIVLDDKVICLQGLGLRAFENREPMTADTLFPLCSCTKSFTTLAIAMLVDEGILSWDDLVRRYVPFCRLSDPLADVGMTLRDLACHRTGVGSHDLLWYHAPWSLEERIRRVAALELDKPFRTAFQYQTALFGAAGLAGSQAAGTSWQDLVQQRVLQPLGMKTSSAVFPGSGAQVALASGYRTDEDDVVRPIPRYPLAEPDPAGSLHATARDLANYLRFQLGDGTWQGKRLLSARRLAEPQQPQIVVPLEGFARAMNPETNFLCYGLGWIVQDYRGKRILMHGGAIDGFRAHFTLVPEAKLGIALLNNLDGSFLNLALSNQLLDRFYSFPPRDWVGYYLDMQHEERRLERERARRLRAEKKGGPPPLPLSAYAGTYRDAAYGDCQVRLKNDRLVWVWGRIEGTLEPFNGNTFLVNQRPLVDALFTFTEGDEGQVASLQALTRTFRKLDAAKQTRP
jgi:CubicO group peptidase (beta-lactamase class C family)